eukprot:Clim_evm1s91 gene=Clim_evmTU1s91
MKTSAVYVIAALSGAGCTFATSFEDAEAEIQDALTMELLSNSEKVLGVLDRSTEQLVKAPKGVDPTNQSAAVNDYWHFGHIDEYWCGSAVADITVSAFLCGTWHYDGQVVYTYPAPITGKISSKDHEWLPPRQYPSVFQNSVMVGQDNGIQMTEDQLFSLELGYYFKDTEFTSVIQMDSKSYLHSVADVDMGDYFFSARLQFFYLPTGAVPNSTKNEHLTCVMMGVASNCQVLTPTAKSD